MDTVRNFLRTGGAKHLADLYCGVGFFGIELSDSIETFIGVEYDRRAIRAAEQNALSRKITNGQFIPAKVEDVLPGLLENLC